MVAPQLGQKDTVSLIFFLHSGHLIKLINMSNLVGLKNGEGRVLEKGVDKKQLSPVTSFSFPYPQAET